MFSGLGGVRGIKKENNKQTRNAAAAVAADMGSQRTW